jgi:broad-specificity NMP kinase
MDQRHLTLKVVHETMQNHPHSDFVVIDSQLRQQFMLDAFRECSISRGNQITLRCNRSERRQRLKKRGWEPNKIDQMEKWAQYLHRESVEVGNITIDTSENTIDDVVDAIKTTILTWGWETGF